MSFIPKYMYLEFLIPIKDYLVTLNLRELIFDWFIPIILSTIAYFFLIPGIAKTDILNFNGYVINALAILIGFSITCITILSTSSNDNIKALKERKSKRKIAGKLISLYQLIFITFSFVLFMEVIALLFNLIYFLIYSSSCINNYLRLFFALNLCFILHIVALNIRNISNFYFIHWNEERT